VVVRYTPVSVEVAQAGDMAAERGRVNVARKGTPVGGGNYLYIWKKRDNTWRVATYMWNTQGREGRKP
jgi:hypothetical protein